MLKIKNKKFVFAFIAYLAMAVGSLLMRVLSGFGVFDGIENPELYDSVWSIIVQIVFMAGIPLLIVFLGERNKDARLTLRELGVRNPPKWWIYPAAVGVGILFFFATMGISFINQLVLIIFNYRIPSYGAPTGGVGMFFLALFAGAVLPGICEETLHRGILVRGTRGHFRETTVILITAAMFALMHTNILQTFYTFCGGIALGFITVKSKSIFPAMIIHFLNNGMATYFDYAEANAWAGSEFLTSLSDFIGSNLLVAGLLWLVSAAALIGLLFVIFKFGCQPNKDTVEKTANFDPASGEPLAQPTKVNLAGVGFGAGQPLTKVTNYEKIFMYCAVFLTVLATAFSFYWGTR